MMRIRMVPTIIVMTNIRKTMRVDWTVSLLTLAPSIFTSYTAFG